MSLLSGGLVCRSGAGFPAELRARENQVRDPSLSRFQPSPQERQPRRAALQMLSGYFILFYISGDKNWFLMWSYAFQVATSLPAPATLGGIWMEKERRGWLSMPSSHKAASRGSHCSVHLTLGDRRSPVQPPWAFCVRLGRFPTSLSLNLPTTEWPSRMSVSLPRSNVLQ